MPALKRGGGEGGLDKGVRKRRVERWGGGRVGGNFEGTDSWRDVILPKLAHFLKVHITCTILIIKNTSIVVLYMIL